MFLNMRSVICIALGWWATASLQCGFAEEPSSKVNRVTVSAEETRIFKSLDGDAILIAKTVRAKPGEVFEVSLEMGAGNQFRWYMVDPSPENFPSLVRIQNDGRKRNNAEEEQKGTGGVELANFQAQMGKGGALVFLWGRGQPVDPRNPDPKTRKYIVPDPRRVVIVTAIQP
jgi:hypothetical protein